MDQLEQARSAIDSIDSQMAALFVKRMQAAETVAAYKREANLPVEDPAREKVLIARNCGLVPEQYRKYYVNYMEAVLTASKSYQYDILEENARRGK